MTPTEFKQTLVQQYQEAIAQVQRIEGAIAACDALNNEETTTTEEDNA